MKNKVLKVICKKNFVTAYAAVIGAVIGVCLCRTGYHQGRLDMLDQCTSALNKALEDGESKGEDSE